MVENYGGNNSNMTDLSLDGELPLTCNASKDKHDQDMEMNSTNSLIREISSGKGETVNGTCMSENSSDEKDLRQDEEYNKDKVIMEQQDSELDYNNKSNKENIDKTYKSKNVSPKSSNSKRKSKNQLKKERMKIHSETHRLMREREITIPYHVPKKRTLKEFLARKKNRANVPLNMPSSQMVEILRDIEESAKNAIFFFKSDSESDVESCNSSEKNRKVKRNQGKENNKSKSLSSSDSSNNNVENNCNTIDNLNIVNENANQNLANQKLDSKSGKGDDNHPNKNGNAVFMCEDTVMEASDLAGGSGKGLVDVVEVEDIGGRDSSVISDGTSNLIMDLNNAQSENPEISNKTEEENKYARERTSEWVKNIPGCEKLQKQNKKEILLRKLNPKLLKITPKLSGEPDSFIDLENDKSSIEIGAKNLKKRFLENCMAPRNKPKTDIELTITTSQINENGGISVATEKLIYTSPEVLSDPDLDKPGAKIQRLREELKKKIEAKWEEENRKKMEELEIEEENKKKAGEGDEIEEEEELIEDDEMEESDDTGESEPEEDDVPLIENKNKRNRFIDDEAEESECDEESGNEGGDELDDNDNEGDEDTPNDNPHAPEENLGLMAKDGFRGNEFNDSQSSLIPPYQPGGGMLHGGSELTQNDEDISLPNNVLSPALRLSLEFSPTTKNACSQRPWDIDLESPEESYVKNNFVPCFPENRNFDLTEAYEFCSGKFPGEGDESRDFHGGIRNPTINSQEFIAPIKDSQLNSNGFDDLTVKETQEGDEGTESGKKRRSRLKVVSDVSDDEIERPLDDDLNDLEDITKGGLSSDDSSEKSVPARNRGKRKNLVFSDEEDDPEVKDKLTEESEEEDEPHNEEDSSQSEEEDPFADEVGREVEYDSEEAEIVNMGEYFEKEAELSGSEWSGDEDERDLDEFEMEDGDDDKLDEKKVRSELEKIHMRTLLDDDAREVRLLQELLFEDGDLFDDGPKRERNFRWKNLGNFFENDGNEGKDPELCQDQEDLEEDEETRKIRHEKELFLLQMKSKREEMGIDDEEYGTSLLKRGRVIIESSSLTATTTKKVSQTVRAEVDEFSFKTPFALTNKRGSFLSRNEEFLARLAKFTSSATDNILGPKHSKNFIFVSKVPDKEVESTKENSQPKRKNLSGKGDHVRNKKVKLDDASANSKISVLDRLT